MDLPMFLGCDDSKCLEFILFVGCSLLITFGKSFHRAKCGQAEPFEEALAQRPR